MAEEIEVELLRRSVKELSKTLQENSEKQNRMLAEMREQLVGVCLKLGITEIGGRSLLPEEKSSHRGEASLNSYPNLNNADHHFTIEKSSEMVLNNGLKREDDDDNNGKMLETSIESSVTKIPSKQERTYLTSFHSKSASNPYKNLEYSEHKSYNENLCMDVTIDALSGWAENEMVDFGHIVTDNVDLKVFDELPMSSMDTNETLPVYNVETENLVFQVYDQLPNQSELKALDQTIERNWLEKNIGWNSDENFPSNHWCCKKNLKLIRNYGDDGEGKIMKGSDSTCEEKLQITEVGVIDEEEGMNYEQLNLKLEGLRSLGDDSCFPLTWPQLLHRLRSQQGEFNVVVELSEIAKYNEWQCYASAPFFRELQMVNEVPYINLHIEEKTRCFKDEWREMMEGSEIETRMSQGCTGNCSKKTEKLHYKLKGWVILMDGSCFLPILLRNLHLQNYQNISVDFVFGESIEAGMFRRLQCFHVALKMEELLIPDNMPDQKIAENGTYTTHCGLRKKVKIEDDDGRVWLCFTVQEEPQLPLPPPEPPPQQSLALSNPWSLRTRTV